jgi:PiT family inorganic phosphate transporter
MPEIALVLAVVSVAYANGANDNYKGVATLYGSDTTSYRDPRFLTAAGLGAGATVLVASLRGLPISTTHALLGSLIGAGLVASRGENLHSMLAE